MKNALLFFTYADSKYEMFVIPYIYFALRNNHNSVVEIHLENAENFVQRNSKALSVLNQIYGDRFLILQSMTKINNPDKRYTPNVIRFIEQPTVKAKYLYIGDIDLLVLDNVLDIHLDLMEKFDIPFSNIIRKGTINTSAPQLSGLHFIEYDLYYPLPELSNFSMTQNDEFILYSIMKMKNIMVPESFQIRPECGIHMSLSRNPFSLYFKSSSKYSISNKIGWTGREYHSVLESQVAEDNFMKLFPLLDKKFKLFISIFDYLKSNDIINLHFDCLKFAVDIRALVGVEDISLKSSLINIDQLISESKYTEGLNILYKLYVLYPDSLIILDKLIDINRRIGVSNDVLLNYRQALS